MLRERVVKVIESVLGPDADPAKTKLDLESLKMLELVVSLEQEFGIEIPDDAPLARITSSADAIVAYVEKKRVG